MDDNKVVSKTSDEHLKQKSLRNNFMNEQDDSLFSKFKKNKDSNPIFNQYQCNKKKIYKRDLSEERRRAREAAIKLAEQKQTLSYDEERKKALDK
jgi:hypothetical protein